MSTINKIKETIKQINKKEIELETQLSKLIQKKQKLNEELLTTCIKNKTHKFERDFDYLSYGEVEYKCTTCGIYK